MFSQVKGEPTPEVQWFLNDKQLQPSEFVVMTVEDETVTLTLKHTTPDMAGEVKCKVSTNRARKEI